MLFLFLFRYIALLYNRIFFHLLDTNLFFSRALLLPYRSGYIGAQCSHKGYFIVPYCNMAIVGG